MVIIDKNITSRDRVEKTFNHQKTDRVPRNYMANEAIHNRLCKHLHISTDLDSLYEVLEIDFKEVAPKYVGKKLFSEIKDRKVDPLWGAVTKWVPNNSGGYWDYCDFPMLNLDEEQIANWPLPQPDDFDYETLFDQCKKYKDKALYFGNPGLGDIMNSLGMIRSMEETYVDMLVETPEIMHYLDRRNSVQQTILERVLEKCHEYISFIWTGEDLGTQNSPLISMEVFQKQICPRHQKLIDTATAYQKPVMMHSCGYSSWTFETLIKMGITAVDTLQPEVVNMSPDYLVKNYGSRLAFHGCISTSKLARMTADEVTKEVKYILDIMESTNGYCLAPTHLIQDNTPVENIIAMYNAAL